MTKIYIVRHGETQWNKEEVFRGRKDIPLNETGKQQAEKVGLYFSHAPVPVNRILSSPLERAMQTAEAISYRTGVAIERTDDFTDMNFGIWEGLTLPEVEKDYPSDFVLWKTSSEKLQIKDGETLAIVRRRVSAGLLNINHTQEDAVVIVTHRVICKILILHALGIGNEHFWNMKFDPGSITLVEHNNERYTLIFSNDTCHLDSHAYRDF
jgi:phosphoserine phosphatase